MAFFRFSSNNTTHIISAIALRVSDPIFVMKNEKKNLSSTRDLEMAAGRINQTAVGPQFSRKLIWEKIQVWFNQ